MKNTIKNFVFTTIMVALCVFAHPVTVNADVPTEYPCTKIITCADGYSCYVFCLNEQDYIDALSFICESHNATLD